MCLVPRSHNLYIGPILLGLPPPPILAAGALDGAPNEFLNDGKEKLVGDTGAPSAGPGEWEQLARHKDEDQVQLDVNRSFIYYPQGASQLP